MNTVLRLDRIQGNIIPGFGTSHQAFLWLTMPSTQAGRRWLGELAGEVASAAQVMTVKQKRREAGYAADGPGEPPTTWVNVAFSRAGLERLGAPGVAEFSAAFREGLAVRGSATLGDPDPTGWLVGGTGSPEAHALLIVAADSAERLEAEVARQRTRLERHGLSDLLAESPGQAICRGETLPGRRRMHEHFGFRDGVAQPELNGFDGTLPGDFILGYPDGDGGSTGQGPDWAEDGSYLVFRRLRQDVFGFRQALRAAAEAAGISLDQLGAKLIGRWKSGAKLGDPVEPWDPGFPAKEADAQYADRFLTDPDGERIPLFAHVRKAYPRDVKGSERHRLLRRGISYGPPLGERSHADDGRDRGLLFLGVPGRYRDTVRAHPEATERSRFPSTRDGERSARGPDRRCPRVRPAGARWQNVDLRPVPQLHLDDGRRVFLLAVHSRARAPRQSHGLVGRKEGRHGHASR